MALAIGRNVFDSYKKCLSQQSSLTPFKSVFSEGQEMKDLENRRRTFLLWPGWGKADPIKLAESGFYFTGDSDTVKCCECKTEISDWKKCTEAPNTVHKRVSPNCPMVISNEASSSGKSSKKSSKNRRKKHRSGEDEDSLSEDGVDTGITSDLAAARYNPTHAFHSRQTSPTKSAEVLAEWNPPKDMKNEEHRLSTFDHRWPVDAPLKPTQLAKAGFFYKGPHDRVECAWCHGRLVNWVAGDDAVGEHARHFPSCTFIQELNNEPLRVLQSKSSRALLRLGHSEDVVLMAVNRCKINGIADPKAADIMEEIFLVEEERAAEQSKNVADALLSSGLRSEDHGEENMDSNMSNMSAQDEVGELRKKNEELKRSTTCKVCLGAEVNIVFLPCRHLVCCADCGSKVEYCPVCRLHIIGTVKTFMA